MAKSRSSLRKHLCQVMQEINNATCCRGISFFSEGKPICRKFAEMIAKNGYNITVCREDNGEGYNIAEKTNGKGEVKFIDGKKTYTDVDINEFLTAIHYYNHC